MRIRKTISITPEQIQWVDKHHISLSKIAQDELNQQMGANNPKGIKRGDVEKSIRVFFMVLVLGMSTLLLGLLAPPIAGSNPIIAALVAVIGAAVIVYGFRGLKVWQERLTRI